MESILEMICVRPTSPESFPGMRVETATERAGIVRFLVSYELVDANNVEVKYHGDVLKHP